MNARMRFRPLTGVCLLAALGFVVIAVMYFTQTAGDLPSFFPGHQAGSSHHHIKHGVAMIGLGCLALIGAWFSTAPGGGSHTRG